MRLTRTRPWWVAIALAALSIQFAASFGHHHNHTSENPLADHASARGAWHHSHAHHDGHGHTGHGHDEHDLDHHNDTPHEPEPADGHHDEEGHCATCWTIVLLAGVLVASLAALYRLDRTSSYLFERVRTACITRRCLRANRARAPPALRPI